ncbi:type II toxin-antitoxin system RelE/ParE family toxin [Treponema putidum]|uniref:Type II toxin-antitoxin system RelE/ParE family toxin n=1 Tax=Treponema putidum TaxID=221027 RepID=A0ABY5HUD8_9SPIR|nr:type II toxin-antitoxin system RelE/ParE family toxin [Treponema putidum]UTY28443.1 type II toxin-antitoxin system RelE/ParE family toxin [Treponema putidum]
MFEIKIPPQAAADLLEIKDYIENEFQNPISFPTDYKFVLANNYSIFYRIKDEVIRIVRTLYSRRDFVRVLFGENSVYPPASS